jgi:hypothetical protein
MNGIMSMGRKTTIQTRKWKLVMRGYTCTISQEHNYQPFITFQTNHHHYVVQHITESISIAMYKRIFSQPARIVLAIIDGSNVSETSEGMITGNGTQRFPAVLMILSPADAAYNWQMALVWVAELTTSEWNIGALYMVNVRLKSINVAGCS